MKNEIHLTAVIHAPLETVWMEWTDNKRLESWLTKKANVEARSGGTYELFWEPEKPEQNSTIGCAITELIPNKKLSFTWKGPVPYAGLMNVSPLPTSVTVTIERISSEETSVSLAHRGFGTGSRWQEACKWQEQSWQGAIAQLQNKYTVKEKEPMGKPTGKIVWFELAVADFEQAKAFYGELFGWQFSPFTEFSKDYWMIDTGEGGISGGLVKKTGSSSAASSPIIYFSVEDIPQSLRRAEKMGAKVIKEKTIITENAGYFALLQDPDQNLIAVWSQR